MIINVYQVYSLNNRNNIDEGVCACLDLNRAKIRHREYESGLHKRKLFTALPPYGIRIIEYEHDLQQKDTMFF